eukprot:TRINITY_DN9142_c0_g1_i3.p2 TRINITY_DN9142_c0_g1~~TRINITY_DN9142_c0_g1_i3.p2  ORF type:complete len:167 (-),score=28.51 TRINITY_DN9142_c0_g1_i3:370-846(-)
MCIRDRYMGVLDNIHYLNENKGIFTDLLSILKVFYDRGLTVIFLSSSLDVREIMKQTPGFDARLKFYQMNCTLNVESLSKILSSNYLNLIKNYFDCSFLKLKESLIWANNLDQFIQKEKNDFLMKLNRLYEVGTNNTTNIEKLIKRLATKNLKKKSKK